MVKPPPHLSSGALVALSCHSLTTSLLIPGIVGEPSVCSTERTVVRVLGKFNAAVFVMFIIMGTQQVAQSVSTVLIFVVMRIAGHTMQMHDCFGAWS